MPSDHVRSEGVASCASHRAVSCVPSTVAGTQGRRTEMGRGGTCAGRCWVWFVHRGGDGESMLPRAGITPFLARGFLR